MRITRRQIIAAAIAWTVIGAAVTSCFAEEPGIALAWTMPTTNTAGQPLTDLAGAKIYYGTSSSNYTHVIDVGLTNACHLTAADSIDPDVTYYLTGTAYNTAGLESDFCNQVARSYHIETPPDTMLIIEGDEVETYAPVFQLVDGTYQRVWVRQ